MRISDWSSDVCSSDLRGERGPVVADRAHVRVLGHGPEPGVTWLGVPAHRGLAPQPVELVVGHATPPCGSPEVYPLQARGHRHRLPLVVELLATSATTLVSGVTAPHPTLPPRRTRNRAV